jgi:leucyl aminopeptidase
MKILKKTAFKAKAHGCVVVPIFQGMDRTPLWREFPELEQPVRQKKMKGAGNEALLCYSLERRCLFLLVGGGRCGHLPDGRRLACKTMSLLRENRIGRAAIYFSATGPYPPAYLRSLIDYLHLNDYRFDRYRKKKGKAVERIEMTFSKRTALAAAELQEREIIATEVRRARDLVNDMPAKVTPDAMVAAFAESASRHGMKLTSWRGKELEKNGMNGLLAVGASSCCQPALLTLAYTPKEFRRTVALVGKGITFDSGGLNLKPGNSMEEMKSDMAGAAAALSVMNAVAGLNLPVRTVALAPLAENLPGRRAYKPGDIIAYANKKTVEIVNTDAEGRLILADALIAASRLKPDLIIELSTLTGAIVTALGDSYAGLFCRNRKLSAALLRAATTSGDLLWEMPLPAEYRESIISKIADLKNANYNGASSVKAGLFLSEFVGKIPFAHIDIAGTAFLSKPNFCLASGGATGFGVRLLIEFLRNLS